MPKPVPEGAEAPDQPPPGAITHRLRWNDSTEILKASDFSDHFVFSCFDFAGNRVDRGRATYCVPVVEIDTVSFAENGKDVAPKDADAIESAIYGSGRVFLEHATTSHHMKRSQREVPASLASSRWPSHEHDESMAGRGDTPGDPHRPPYVPTFFATGDLEAATGARGQRVTFWRRVKRWLLSRPGASRPLNPNPLSPHDD